MVYVVGSYHVSSDINTAAAVKPQLKQTSCVYIISKRVRGKGLSVWSILSLSLILD